MKRGDAPPTGYPGLGLDADHRVADMWPRHRARRRNRRRRRSSVTRNRQTT